jgi:hypothetical protein
MLSQRWRVVVIALALLANLAVLAVLVDRTLTRPAVDEPAGRLAGSSTTAENSGPAGGVVSVEVAVSNGADGSLEVQELMTSEVPLTDVLLRLDALPGALEGSDPARVDELSVEASGLAATVAPDADGDTRVNLPVASDAVAISYRLAGAVERDDLATDGRALLRLRPLVVDGPPGSYAVLRFSDITVRNLVCPDRPLREQLCGRVVDQTWSTVRLPLDEAAVVAQVDLPAVSGTSG